MVKPPKFDTIVEERQDLSEPPPIDQEFTVALRRESMDQTFGFSVVQCVLHTIPTPTSICSRRQPGSFLSVRAGRPNVLTANSVAVQVLG
jgi:hypothetical protein